MWSVSTLTTMSFNMTMPILTCRVYMTKYVYAFMCASMSVHVLNPLVAQWLRHWADIPIDEVQTLPKAHLLPPEKKNWCACVPHL